MKRLGTSLVLLLVIGLIACSRGDVPTQPSSSQPSSLEEFEKKPFHPGGSVVFRMEDVLIRDSTDPQRDLIAWHIFAENWTGCGGTENFPLADVQTIRSPSGSLHIVGIYPEIPVYIYRLSEWNALGGSEICDFLANNWLYRGRHTMVALSNDIIQAGPGASTLGWSAHGTVQDPEGNLYRYSEQQRGIVDKEASTLVVNWLTENIRVHPLGR